MRRGVFYAVMALLACGMALAAYVAERLNNERYAGTVRGEVQQHLTQARDRLDGNLNGDIQLVRGLVGVVALEPDLVQARFERAAQPLFAGRTQLRNIAVAPDMVIRLVYPLQANQKAIGFDYRNSPAQFETADQARLTRQIVLAGPLNLVQGGVGIVARLPVYLPNAAGQEYFWGVVSAVVDAELLYRNSGLRDESLPIEIAIRGRDGKGADGEVFFGRPELFAESPVLAAINLPHGSWQLAAVPRGGWPTRADNLWLLRVGMAVVALLVLGAFLVLGRALSQASQARERAESSGRQLSATLENTPDVAVQWYDPQGRVIYWNHASERLSGWSAGEAVGKTLDQLIFSREQATDFMRRLGEIVVTGEAIKSTEHEIRTRDDQLRWVESTIFAIPGETPGKPILVCMDVDITPLLLNDYVSVYKVVCDTQQYVLKIVKKEEDFPDKYLQEEFENSKTLGNEHPYFIKGIDIQRKNITPQITQVEMLYEYGGKSLGQLKATAKLQEIKLWILQSLRAFSYMQERKIAHFDIKPDNMVYENGILKVFDLGSTMNFSHKSSDYCSLGTKYEDKIKSVTKFILFQK